MDKAVVVRIYNGILFRHKNNEFESLVVRSINLEPVKQSEVSQKEKKKISYMNAYVHIESIKIILVNFFAG